MKHVLILVLALGLVATHAQAPTNGTGEMEFQMNRPEGERTFWVYVPTTYNPSNSYALVFAFHGLGGECNQFGHETGMVDKAEAEGFILVYPCGTPGGFFGVKTAWNAGTCCMEGSPIDDIAFARAMVQFAQSNWNIDPKRVFSSGFSNGGFMTETLMCNSSDVFIAGASVSGTVVVFPGNDGGLQHCDAMHAAVGETRALLHIHGDSDAVVPWNGNVILGFPAVPIDFARWAQRNGCTGSPVNTFTNGPYSNQVYQDCPSGGTSGNVTVELVEHESGTHEWPSDQYFDTATYIWQFFSKINPPQTADADADADADTQDEDS